MSGKMIENLFMYRKKRKILNRKTGNLPGIVSCVVLCALMLFSDVYPVLAQESCVTSECHTDMGKFRVRERNPGHGPVVYKARNAEKCVFDGDRGMVAPGMNVGVLAYYIPNCIDPAV